MRAAQLAYLDFEDDRVITARRPGGVSGVVGEGVAVREDWVIRVPRGEAVGPWVSRVFGREDRPDGVFSLYDDVAIDAIDALERLGLSVPGDVAVSATNQQAGGAAWVRVDADGGAGGGGRARGGEGVAAADPRSRVRAGAGIGQRGRDAGAAHNGWRRLTRAIAFYRGR
ncbi:MAG: substrate-binding domain-containing protein [Phycisphaerales bacterium]